MLHVILGLLLIAPQSLYDLLKSFGAGVSLIYSASSGSIKRALDSALRQQLIDVASVDPGARGRKVYRVTDAGRAAFHAWMTGELTGPDLESAALSRLYFLGLLDPADRASVLRRIVRRIDADLARLLALNEQLATVDYEQRELATHQLAALDYGIASHRFALGWFGDHLAREEAAGETD